MPLSDPVRHRLSGLRPLDKRLLRVQGTLHSMFQLLRRLRPVFQPVGILLVPIIPWEDVHADSRTVAERATFLTSDLIRSKMTRLEETLAVHAPKPVAGASLRPDPLAYLLHRTPPERQMSSSSTPIIQPSKSAVSIHAGILGNGASGDTVGIIARAPTTLAMAAILPPWSPDERKLRHRLTFLVSRPALLA